ncbi:MAG: hypothetical protein R8K22_04395 [Mariprofundaceae bacterium]
MAETPTEKWKPGKRDLFFLGFVGLVVLALVLGTSERTTKGTPNDDTHRKVTSRTACMQCHGVDGIKPQPKRHTKADQCFQCHAQPESWQGAE